MILNSVSDISGEDHVLMVLGGCIVLVMGLSLAVALHPSPIGAQAEQQIDITINDFTYTVKQSPLQLHIPTVITVRNEDTVRHNFNSATFHGMLVETAHEGVMVYGKGLEGLFLDPATTSTIRFTPETAGTFGFQCSIHEEMRGEIFLMTVGDV